MKIKLLCSEVDCDYEVDSDPSDEVYAIGELQKIPRLCFSCAIKKQEQQEKRKEGMITDILGDLLSTRIKLEGIELKGSEWRIKLSNMNEDDLREVKTHINKLLELAKKV